MALSVLRYACLLCVIVTITVRTCLCATTPAGYVDPFIGTDGTGHLFPGASLPFGMVVPSPDCSDTGWSFASGYQYHAPRILGFSNTHISGAGVDEFGDVLLQPSGGIRWSSTEKDFSSGYEKKSEFARPGLYAVRLAEHGVRVELTATQRVAFQRFQFDQPGRVQVLADFQHGLHAAGTIRVASSTVAVDRVSGELSGTELIRGFVDRETSFLVRFDHPIESAITLPASPGEKAPRYLLTFDLKGERELQARVAFSTVDVDGARRNMAGVDGKDFDQVKTDAFQSWNELLSRISIEGTEVQKRIFYTALYHTLLHPSDIADIDGRVRGPTGVVIHAPGGVYYSTLSLWDTFRGAFPLLTIVAPERVDGIIATLLAHQRQQGILPVWTAWGRESWCMIGNPALPLIANAIADGFKGFDLNEALNAMVATSTRPRPAQAGSAQIQWSLYDTYGYLPFDKVSNEAVSATLELGIGDDAVARVARSCGRAAIAQRFALRAQNYRKLFDPSTGLERGRDSLGNWRNPFDAVTPTSPLNNPGDYTEGNAWQYTLSVALHDPEGLVSIIGGPQEFGNWLDRFFASEGLHENKWLGQEAIIGQYAHGNEPSHHVAYLYAWSDRPWRGHERIREIVRRFYSDKPDGIIGNDDAGQMSAWYVLSCLGFYPVVPASGRFVAGAPQLSRADLHLSNGHTLRIRAVDFGTKCPYAERVTWEGKPIDPTALSFSQIMQGGLLEYSMNESPSKR